MNKQGILDLIQREVKDIKDFYKIKNTSYLEYTLAIVFNKAILYHIKKEINKAREEK